MDNEQDFLPMYARIAADIAAKIVDGKYPEKQRLPGKTTLASVYSVSSETVRKAQNSLATFGVVRVQEGCGTVVLSREAAAEFLEASKLRDEQNEIKDSLKSLLSDYRELGMKIMDIGKKLIDARYTPMPTEQELPLYEISVPPESDKAGMTIGDLRFWQSTGATIVAIKRGQHIQTSPGPYAIIRPGDVLVYVGDEKTRRAVHQFFTFGKVESTIFRIQEQINTAIHMRELSLVADALHGRIGDISDFMAMAKGMTNHSYSFSFKGERYILRIPGEGTVNLIDRFQEAAVYRAIAGTCICDDVVYINPENGLKVTKYINEVRPCDPKNESDLSSCMALLRRFHNIGLKVEHEFDLFENIAHYESLRRETSQYDDYEKTKANVFKLKPFIEKHRERSCLTHIDAVPDNFLFHPDGEREGLQLIDWEYAGMQDPHVDIAMFCLYCSYTREQADHLIDIYFENNCTTPTRVKIHCYIAVCGLLWSNWAEYKHTLGIEYGSYGKSQYNYAKEFYKIARKEIIAYEKKTE